LFGTLLQDGRASRDVPDVSNVVGIFHLIITKGGAQQNTALGPVSNETTGAELLEVLDTSRTNRLGVTVNRMRLRQMRYIPH